jgi:hypothetical protein
VNEKIRQLAEEAGARIPYGSDQQFISDLDIEKFALLIIEECLHACMRAKLHYPPDVWDTHQDGVDFCINEIKFQFGVDQ